MDPITATILGKSACPSQDSALLGTHLSVMPQAPFATPLHVIRRLGLCGLFTPGEESFLESQGAADTFLLSTLSPFTQPCTKNFRSRRLFRGGRDFCSKTFLLKGAVGKEGRMGMARRPRRILYPLFLAENKRKSRSYFSPSPFWF